MRPLICIALAFAGAAWGADKFITPPEAFLNAEIDSPASLEVFETPLTVKEFVAMIDPINKCDLDGAKVQGWLKSGDVYSLQASFNDKVTNQQETLKFQFRHKGTLATPLAIDSTGIDAETKRKQPSGSQWVALLRAACARQGVAVGKLKPGAAAQELAPEPGNSDK